MSFRDLTPRGKQPQGLEFEPENGGGVSPHHGRGGPLQQQQQKSPLVRSSSTSNRPTQSLNNYQQYNPQINRSQSDSTHHNQHHLQSAAYADGYDAGATQQSLLVQQREEDYAMQIMKQREDELRDINRKMHVVNEIYKDLGEVVEQQQEQIDQVEDQFGGAADATRRGLEQIEKANKTHKKMAEQNVGGEGSSSSSSDDKRKQFFLFHYLSKSASEIAKLVSVCGGSGSASYVDGESWNKKK